jgi:hypothetical protein
MDVVGVHQVFKVAEWSHSEAQDERDQNHQGEKAMISGLGSSCEFGDWVGQSFSVQE